MNRRPARRIAKETDEESEYKDWLHTLPCVVTGYEGELIQASHLGEGGIGQKKGSWFEAVPMRSDVHEDWGQYKGYFEGWDREKRRLMGDYWIAQTKAAWNARASGRR